MKNLTEIRMGSKWKTLQPFSIGIGSHSQNPNTTSLNIPIGTIIQWEDDSRNGNVWFNVILNDIKYRGKVESGAITNVIKRGLIELHESGKGFVIYNGEYLQKLLKN
jgi:hypothetical protein